MCVLWVHLCVYVCGLYLCASAVCVVCVWCVCMIVCLVSARVCMGCESVCGCGVCACLHVNVCV